MRVACDYLTFPVVLNALNLVPGFSILYTLAKMTTQVQFVSIVPKTGSAEIRFAIKITVPETIFKIDYPNAIRVNSIEL